jgi:hypothetical protein
VHKRVPNASTNPTRHPMCIPYAGLAFWLATVLREAGLAALGSASQSTPWSWHARYDMRPERQAGRGGSGRSYLARTAMSTPRDLHAGQAPNGGDDGVPQPMQVSSRSHVHVPHHRLGPGSHGAFTEHSMSARVHGISRPDLAAGRRMLPPEYSPRPSEHGFPTSIAMDDMPTVRRLLPSPSPSPSPCAARWQP